MSMTGFDPNATYTGGLSASSGFPGSAGNTQGNAPGVAKGAASLTVDPTGVPGAPPGAGADTYGGGSNPGPMPGLDTYGGGSRPGPVQPNYQPPAAPLTINAALDLFFSWTPDQMASMEQKLYAGGFFPTAVYDSANRVIRPADVYDAYKAALLQAAYTQSSFDQTVIGGAAQFGGLGGGTGPATASGGRGVRVFPGGKIAEPQTDPETIRLGANAAYQKLLGRDMNDQEAQGVVNTVRSDEAKKGAQRAAADAASTQATVQTNEILYGQGPGTTIGATGPTQGATPQGPPDVIAAITQAANEAGVPVNLALAIAQHESGLNPQAVGDQGTSFGLFQLHQGGELGSMSKQQAFDPYQNAKVALAQVASVLRAHPDWSPGQVAAAAQRPADQPAYAAAVNAILGGQGAPVQATTPGGATGQSTDVFLQPTVADISTPITPEGAATQQIQTQNTSEMQQYAAQKAVDNFTAALHSMPGDSGASKPAAVKP